MRRIEYIEKSLSEVLAYFAKDFQPRVGEPNKPQLLNTFVDHPKDTVVFVVMTEDGKC